MSTSDKQTYINDNGEWNALHIVTLRVLLQQYCMIDNLFLKVYLFVDKICCCVISKRVPSNSLQTMPPRYKMIYE